MHPYSCVRGYADKLDLLAYCTKNLVGIQPDGQIVGSILSSVHVECALSIVARVGAERDIAGRSCAPLVVRFSGSRNINHDTRAMVYRYPRVRGYADTFIQMANFLAQGRSGTNAIIELGWVR